MGRPREFDLDDALEKAMGVFWTFGYEGATLPRLLDGMALTRGSFYKAFTDKRSLFLAALQVYQEQEVDPPLAMLLGSGIADGAERIRRVFENVVDRVRGGDRSGCLLCNAAAGPGPDDPEIKAQVQVQLDRMREGFLGALADSHGHKALSDEARRQLALLLLTQYVGLRILTRGQAPLDVIEESARALDRVLAQD